MRPSPFRRSRIAITGMWSGAGAVIARAFPGLRRDVHLEGRNA
jgi:hypothetical protein